MERPGATTLKGTPKTLIGPELKPGDPAPDFSVSDSTWNTVTLKDTGNKVRIISVIPSLDTPVCDAQTKRFNEEASSLPYGTEVLTVSMDLPFAQARFCGEKGTNSIQTASDHRDGSFGRAYGTLIEPLRLEARAVFVVSPDGTLKYAQYVPEVTEQPDYSAALAAASSHND